MLMWPMLARIRTTGVTDRLTVSGTSPKWRGGRTTVGTTCCSYAHFVFFLGSARWGLGLNWRLTNSVLLH